MDPFVSTQWLAEHIDDPEIIVVDGTWYLPDAGRNARAEFEAGHIPGAVFFDIDAIADTSGGLPHMLPEPEIFARMAGALGIASDRTIVVYDEHGLFSAPRVWWSLRTMGAGDVRILSGGGPKWRLEGHPLEQGPSRAEPARFDASFDATAIAAFDAVRAASGDGSAQILDARPAPRFAGEAPEPRPGLRSGHIPASSNLPFTQLIADGKLKPAGELSKAFSALGIDRDRPVITTCGSGVTAAVLTLALAVTGARAVALYDGSWAEWGARVDPDAGSGSAQ
ncbi:3-mercaptopyruvate sulfurtransferase [Pelagibacterium montanilacus]|uniref:3-mercaptopyruvate sulfurtransferase n=1 Tax=Pelagibacterium montanilacus TaxID=2185280 RepID=UPI000F8C66A0|nr:3-mercaptopyruvate sulfurtransferase [Pelagibacterium montanilacus]